MSTSAMRSGARWAPAEDVLRISAKEGTNVDQVLEAIVKGVPPPTGDAAAPLRALIFDSHYDSHKGVIAYVRVVQGSVAATDEGRMVATGALAKPLEIGYLG